VKSFAGIKVEKNPIESSNVSISVLTGKFLEYLQRENYIVSRIIDAENIRLT